nr:Gag-pre-integrase domain, Gag-polypeptide of LTR copia-type [Tanacetum cinerariifolium]
LGKKPTEVKEKEKEKERTYEFLMGLDDQFSVREVAAFQASFQGRREQTRNQQEKGWTKTKKGSQVDKTQTCSECGRDGHDRNGCFKIIGYPEWWPGKGEGDKPKPRATMVETKPCPIPGMTEEQYAMFLKLFGNNREEPVVANMGLKTRNLIGTGDCRGDLYWMEGIKEERQAMMVTIDSWHKRLGHASNVKLSSVSFLKGVSFNFKDKVYDSCNKAKLTRLPFP